ncbi:conserved hypothetical protein, membrane [Candidatus Desulfofervidus auxilii]|uniref:Uncharacterized protein n=1 Tax=Desulfofervidus auxilii TaxID=1621989 RepID=A0A7U4TI49_DESA2|nr:hypothetical protein [Candidatus Desulfofervidus auxilii]AMM40951.1 conserved hypothetical protein, membrane [Candidatus Desulfofervidus auxilii]CAD7775496.1 hypothetical protein BLFGPEAP_01322 [Candidatus Methanoperedenaceae archaeon GB50]
METKIFLYALGIWFILVVAAILNGAFRESFITSKVGEQVGHVISTVIFICVILVVTYLFLSNLKINYTKTDLLLIGALWLILTILFEFVFGHYVMGHSWNRLFADYNILKGRVWSFVLLTTFIAPLLIGSILQK